MLPAVTVTIDLRGRVAPQAVRSLRPTATPLAQVAHAGPRPASGALAAAQSHIGALRTCPQCHEATGASCGTVVPPGHA
eukprot:2269489-Prymnesium_polylepis.1